MLYINSKENVNIPWKSLPRTLPRTILRWRERLVFSLLFSSLLIMFRNWKENDLELSATVFAVQNQLTQTSSLSMHIITTLGNAWNLIWENIRMSLFSIKKTQSSETKTSQGHHLPIRHTRHYPDPTSSASMALSNSGKSQDFEIAAMQTWTWMGGS